MSTSPIIPGHQVVLCLAGHIDHGKSSLVRALTGGVVDRLPEEQRRGMTIELGFAHLDAGGIRFSFIDVPGHERFVQTMLAGASGVDLALLVVAADDSVMPQTREHLALLELLGIRRGVIAITKCDLADAEQLEMVRLEVGELVEPTLLAQAAIIEVSTRTGQGVVELQQALLEAAQPPPVHATDDPRFRMPIDRVFSPAGQGTVVTGTVWNGTARVGDMLHLLPSETAVRIRRLQSQGVEVESVSAGQRAALNLAGIKTSAIHRGDELATSQAFEPSRRHLVWLRLLPDTVQALKNRDLVRLHIGASQTTAQVLLGQRAISSGESAFAVLRCHAPIVAAYGQPFVVRQLSPARTIGGGTILAPALQSTNRLNRCLDAAPGLSSQDPATRIAAYVELRHEAEFDTAIESRTGLNRLECEAACQLLAQRKILMPIGGPQPLYVTAERFRMLQQRMLDGVRTELERRRPAGHLPQAVVISALSHKASLSVLDAALKDLITRGELVRRGDQIGPRVAAELSQRQRRLLNILLAECAQCGRTPPTLKEFAARQSCSPDDLEPLVLAAVAEGGLVRLSDEFVIDPPALTVLRKSLADYLKQNPVITLSEIREHWGSTRKYTVPILEYFDQQQITLRDGHVRTAGPRLDVS